MTGVPADGETSTRGAHVELTACRNGNERHGEGRTPSPDNFDIPSDLTSTARWSPVPPPEKIRQIEGETGLNW
jgi:hypothetical protein